MDAETIKAIADQIANQTILASWKTWGLQFAFWIVGTALAAFAGAFYAKRGEHKAIKADFALLLSQLEKNTTAVKTIETDISHADWTVREWKTIRRVKLEELSKNLPLLLNEMQTQAFAALNEGKTPMQATASFREIEMICNLYFPELSIVAGALRASYFEQYDWVVKASVELHHSTSRAYLKENIANAIDIWVDEKSANAQVVMAQMRSEIAQLMQEFAGVKRPATSATMA